MAHKYEKPTSNDSLLWLLGLHYSSNFLEIGISDAGTSEIMSDGSICSTIHITHPVDKNKSTIKSNSYFNDENIAKIICKAGARPDEIINIKEQDKWLIPASNFDRVIRRSDLLKLRLNLAAGFYDLLSQAQTVKRSTNKAALRPKIKLPKSVLRLSLWDTREQVRATIKASETLLNALGLAARANKKQGLDKHIVGREFIGSILSNGIVPKQCSQTALPVQESLWNMMPLHIFSEPLGEEIPDYWQRKHPSLLPFVMPWFCAPNKPMTEKSKAENAISFYAILCDSIRLLYAHAQQAECHLTELLEARKRKSRNEGDIGFRNFFSVLCQAWELSFGDPVYASKNFVGFASDVCADLRIPSTGESIRGQIKARGKEGIVSYAPMHHAFDEMLVYNSRHVQTKVPVTSKIFTETVMLNVKNKTR